MKISVRTLILTLIVVLLSGCSTNTLVSAEFTNTTPAKINIGDNVYILTNETLSAGEVNKEIGKITKVNTIVSYTEDQNPYKSPNKIFEVKNVKPEEIIAVQINDKLYKAKIDRKP